MPTTIRTAEPRELLSLVPYQLGFRPTDSAVLVSLRGDRGRVGLVARVDLPDLVDPATGPGIARSLVTHLVDDGADRAVLVLYPRGPRADAAAEVRAARAHVLAAAAPRLQGVECWVVGPTGYYAAGCADAACCPAEGRPLADLQSTEVGLHMVLAGAAVLASRAEVAQIPLAPAAARRSARRAAARWSRHAADAVDPAELVAWRREGMDLWRAELARAAGALAPAVRGGTAAGAGGSRGAPGPRLTTVVAGRLQAVLADVRCRDGVLLSLVPDGGPVADGVLAGHDEGVGAALDAIVDPVAGVPPDPALLAGAVALLEQVAAHCPRRALAPPLTLLGVLAWWQGEGARAAVLLERVLEVEPSYRLAALLGEALAAGMPPGWLRPARG
ncbi:MULTISPECIES: DUF4192 family protein [unclassified Actinotalea]|uniref:DUF4192 family protein n=1 Tax=unclassified Actinotalea TaxID=2638618 RepID=UPI0015F44B83|nr:MULTISPECIES: DUF4192 family protein [unclassified Actinotalea]